MTVRILQGDVRAMLATLEPESVHCVVTSVPYWGLRAYGTEPQVWGGRDDCLHVWGDEGRSSQRLRNGEGSETAKQAFNETLHPSTGTPCLNCNAWRGEHGQEPTPELYIANEVAIWREVRRVLRKDGIAWLNVGDSYAAHPGQRKEMDAAGPKQRSNNGSVGSPSRSADGLKAKDLCLIPEQLAIALRKDGWWIRSRIPWVKRSAMPDSTTDRPGQAVEYFFLLTKSARYFFDMAAVRQSATDESKARYERGRSNGHKWVDGGPGDQTIAKSFDGMSDEAKAGRNLRNADLLFQSLEAPHGLISSAEGEPLALDVNTAGYPGAHFATFAPRLIEPLIKASTSERGCCVECGAPWVRTVERDGGDCESTERPKAAPDHRGYGSATSTLSLSGSGSKEWADRGTKLRTIDWQPSCSCEPAEPLRPATVLDIFGGSGTTGLVADRLGRDAILIEIQPEYAEMAEKRIKGDAPLFAEVSE